MHSLQEFQNDDEDFEPPGIDRSAQRKRKKGKRKAQEEKVNGAQCLTLKGGTAAKLN